MHPLRISIAAAILVVGLLPIASAQTASAPAPAPAPDAPPVGQAGQVGQRLPSGLVLTTPEGEAFDLDAAVEAQPAVLIFYRGGWCPYCNTHLKALRDIEDDLVGLGYQLLAISPDRPEALARTQEKQAMRYRLLSDQDVRAATALGLAFTVDEATRERYRGYGIDLEEASGRTHHQLPVPAVLVVRRDRTIAFRHADPNYKVRLSPAQVLEAARQAAGASAPPSGKP